jgi:hypothetical protein
MASFVFGAFQTIFRHERVKDERLLRSTYP